MDVVKHRLDVAVPWCVLADLDALFCRCLFKNRLRAFNFPARVYGLDLLNKRGGYIFSVRSEMLRPQLYRLDASG